MKTSIVFETMIIHCVHCAIPPSTVPMSCVQRAMSRELGVVSSQLCTAEVSQEPEPKQEGG
jgi:hypothetical protein